MAAGMHHRYFHAAVIMCGYMAGIRETRLLRDGQSIEFGAQHDHGAGAVLENTHYTCTADSGGNVVSELAKLVSDFSRSLLLMIGKLGIAVQVEIERFDLGIDGIDLIGCSMPGLGGPHRSREQRGRKQDEDKQETFHNFSRERH